MNLPCRSVLIPAILILLTTPLAAGPAAKAKAKPADAPKDEVKIQAASPDSRIHFLYRGQKRDLPITSFHAKCKGYSPEGVQYTTPAGQIVVAWKDIDFILPHWQEGMLLNGRLFSTEALLPAACPDAHLSQAVKKTAATKGKNKAPAEEEQYPLNEVQVLAFDAKGLERGMAALATKGIIFEPVTGMELVLVRGGCFEMGDVFEDEESPENERPSHRVCLADYYVGTTEVTQNEWMAVMQKNPSFFHTCANCPVENVSWFDAQDFLRTMNQKTGKNFRLPTEAEWEYAARSGGKKERIAGLTSDDVEEAVGEYAWYTGNTQGHSSPAATRRPNKPGLFDLSGNVSEWVHDRYGADYYRKSPRDNPEGPEIGDHRVNRGGCWSNSPARLRTTYRDHDNAQAKRNNLGFRVALPAK